MNVSSQLREVAEGQSDLPVSDKPPTKKTSSNNVHKAGG